MPTFLSVVLIMGFIVLLVTGALSLLRDLTATWYRPTESTTTGAEEVAQHRRRELEPPRGEDADTN